MRQFRKLVDKDAGGQALLVHQGPVGRNFIVDSGASFNLIGEKDLTASERKRVRKACPIQLNTANGTVESDRVLDIHVQDLDVSIEFYILKNCPPVISMGFLTKIDFQFTWKKFNGEPAMRITLPSGNFTECMIQNDVPRIFVAKTDGQNSSNAEDADAEVDTTDAAPRAKRKRGGRKHTATELRTSPEAEAALQQSMPKRTETNVLPVDKQGDPEGVLEASPESDS